MAENPQLWALSVYFAVVALRHGPDIAIGHGTDLGAHAYALGIGHGTLECEVMLALTRSA